MKTSITDAWFSYWPTAFVVLMSALVLGAVLVPTMLLVARPSGPITPVERFISRAPAWLTWLGGHPCRPLRTGEMAISRLNETVATPALRAWDAHRAAAGTMQLLTSLLAAAGVGQLVWTWWALTPAPTMVSPILVSASGMLATLIPLATVRLLTPIAWHRRAPFLWQVWADLSRLERSATNSRELEAALRSVETTFVWRRFSRSLPSDLLKLLRWRSVCAKVVSVLSDVTPDQLESPQQLDTLMDQLARQAFAAGPSPEQHDEKTDVLADPRYQSRLLPSVRSRLLIVIALFALAVMCILGSRVGNGELFDSETIQLTQAVATLAATVLGLPCMLITTVTALASSLRVPRA
ncbi:hypothetical protein E4U02_08000 [Microbacterium paludicola]|uniref:Uncharacterized protein n=1 Tax=Microbacterium paludicola TaxID=300019 RepID=A0A4Y9FUV5_9MICO|nr:hypothetical protein [Microbacterium paludicola]MBF0816351.1 hypothetical protein [Microbacterium paludicola]TFU33013.1 hypothetical protein E4U02_08000 [Microbacterium paludicola]